MITVSTGKLFCSACREELSLKHSIIKGHVQSAKRAQHKKQLAEKRSREHDISKAFKAGVSLLIMRLSCAVFTSVMCSSV